jgi:phosphoglycolate phosphatase-like HAD superfamily hydrolase
MPLTPGVPEMLTRLKELGCDIIIISDANLVFINEPLKASGLDHLVKAIFTNPAFFNDNGLLALQPFSNQVSHFSQSLRKP